MKEWNHKDIWTRRNKDFCIEIIHYVVETEHRPEHRWNVEAYIYPTHQHFSNFSGDAMFQTAASVLPLHCGPSLLRWHCKKDGVITSVQVGADYNHLYDERFSDVDCEELAGEIFRDSECLFKWLVTFKADEYQLRLEEAGI